MQIVKIPEDRVKVLIGKNGETKEEIEKMGNLNLDIGKEGDVAISSKDALAEWKACDVIKAIGRGFSPERATKLFSDEYVLKIINLKEIFSNEKQRERYKARVIGTKGKAKKNIEELSGAEICVYGNTVSIIGRIDEAALAERAINMLLSGASHGSVYFVLQKERQRMKM